MLRQSTEIVLSDSLQESENILQNLTDLPKNASEFGRETFSYDTALILVGMGMEKYIDLFKANDISLEIFMDLQETDLVSLGISDKDDRKRILTYTKNNRSVTFQVDLYAPENATEDSLIIRNILHQSVLLDKQVKEVLKQFSTDKCDDYFIANTMKASQVLKLVTEKSIKQIEKICDSIHDDKNGCLTSELTKKSKLDLSADKLPSGPKLRKMRVFLMVLTTVGMCSLAVLIAPSMGGTS